MPLTPSDNPVLSKTLPALTTGSVAHPDTWNPINQTLLNNDVALDNSIKKIDTKAGQLGERIDGLEASSAVSVRKAVGLGWTYGGNAILFELFDPAYTLIDLAPIRVVQGIKNDDSLDVADTSKLKVGEYYLLTDPTAVDGNGAVTPLTIMVQISAILSGERVRLTANLAQAWGASAVLARSTMTVQGASAATVVPGDMYLTRTINIGTDAEGGALVIRRSLNSGVATLYYRDAYQPTWKATGWSLRRTGGDIPAGFADYEYVLPMRGEGSLRMEFSGEPMSVQHMVALGSPTGLGGFVNPDQRPAAPVTSSPANALTGVPERPTLSIAGYSSPVGSPQGAVQFQLATVGTFAQILLDTGTLPPALSYSVPAGVLVANKVHYWRSRVMDVGGLWSDWSAAGYFTTAVTYAFVVAPAITGPAANAVDVPEQPTLSCSAFAVVGSAQTHSSSQWRIRSQTGNYAAPVWDSGIDVTNKLSVVVPAAKLLAGQSTYYAQVRQQGSVTGWSEWSPEVKFTTKAQFANVIGIALLTTGGGSGTWSRIDENGAAKVTDAAFFSSHSIYGAIQEVTIDGQAMVKIPAFYVKAGSIAAGPNAGKRAWWVADQPTAGFVLHPAFMEAGSPLAQYWVGKYQATNDAKLKSVSVDLAPSSGVAFQTLKDLAAARNVSGVTGFSVWSYHQLSAIQLLALIEMGGADSQALIAPGNQGQFGGKAVVNHPVLIASAWRGITGLWGNVFQFVDGLQTDAAGKYKIWDKNGNKTYQVTNVASPLGDGYPVTVAADSGALYDLSLGFLPATLDSSAGNGSLGDNYNRVSNVVNAEFNHGGYYGSSSAAGLFCVGLSSAGAGNAYTGTRLAKV